MSGSASDVVSVEMREVLQTSSLQELDEAITRILANQKGQTLIRGDDLGRVIDLIRSRVSSEDRAQQLHACAMIGRVAAIATGREQQAYKVIDGLFSGEPPAIDQLADGKAKAYAAAMLRHVSATWIGGYCAKQALEVDSADLARAELLSIALERSESLATWLALIAAQSLPFRSEPTEDQLLKRRRRVLAAMESTANAWNGELGTSPGVALGDCLMQLLGERPNDPDVQTLAEIVDSALGILIRVIQLRFSHALQAETYAVIERCRNFLGLGLWSHVSRLSLKLVTVRTNLLEAALVLARQNRTDARLATIISYAYPAKPQAVSELHSHFLNSVDIDPDVRRWWETLGARSAAGSDRQQQVGVSEDEQIGLLLLEVDDAREAMEKVGRAVVPFLEISDPVLAATARRAAASYSEISQIVKRLARMRRVSRGSSKGVLTEFNPREHQMIGTEGPGIRMVRIVRDGIFKDFAGRVKTLVKPWVEPAN